MSNVFNCNGNVICSPEDSIDPNYDLEMARMTNSHTSFVSMFDWRAWAVKIILVIFIIWIFWRAALQWCLKIMNLCCNPKYRLTFCQTIKVFFSSIDEAFNPLSLTRGEFKRKIRGIENELEAIRATANRLGTLINRLEAEENSIPPNITLPILETTPLDTPSELEDQDYVLIHTNTNTMTELPKHFNQIRQGFHNFRNFSKTLKPKGSNIQRRTVTFYNSASKKQPKLATLTEHNNKSTETIEQRDESNCLTEYSDSQSNEEGSFEYKK